MSAGSAGDPVPGLIVGQLTALAQRIQRANLPGSLDGLFAFHVLRNASVPRLTWEVSPVTEPWLEQNADRLGHAPQLAALGYGLTHFGHSVTGDEARTRLVAGLEQLMRRAPYPSDGVTFLNDPCQLLGIGLAAETVVGKLPAFGEWLRRTTDDPRFRSADARLDLIRQHVRGILGGGTPAPACLTGSEDAAHLALLHWMAATGTARLPDTADLRALQRSVLHGTLHIRAEDLTIPDAALLLAAAEDNGSKRWVADRLPLMREGEAGAAAGRLL